MNRSELKQLGKGLAFLSPWLIGFAGLTLVPLALSFYYSLCDYSLLTPPMFIGLENYGNLLADPVFWKSLRNTISYGCMAIPAGLLMSLGMAMLLNVKVPAQSVWRTIIFLPSLVPVVASAMLWLWLLNARVGLINAILRWVGIDGPGWIADPKWALPSLAFMSLWGLGNTIVIFLAGLQDVPVELYEAAELDGAGVIARIRHVTIPALSPVIFFNLVVAMIASLHLFDVPYIMTQGGPARSTYLLSMYLYDSAFTFLQMGYASAMAWIMLIVVLALTGVAFWSSKRWVHYEGA